MRERARRVTERLDAPAHDERELEHSLEQVAAVNRWLGGTRAAVRAVATAVPRSGRVRVLDVGCGSGDVTYAVAEAMNERGRSTRITATDLHPQILALAQKRLQRIAGAELARVDARALPFRDAAFDVGLMSLTLHHFEDEEAVLVLRELGRVAHTVIINDLERCWPNYVGARALALTLWAGNRLTRHDGPLSVLRAFTRAELVALARSAGLREIRVERRFFHRLVLTARSARAAASSTVA